MHPNRVMSVRDERLRWTVGMVLLVGAVAAAAEVAVAEEEQVVVFKCCGADQLLKDDQCRVGDGLGWAPVVYSPAKRTFLEPGSTPKHWRWEASRPSCSRPEFIPVDRNYPAYVLFDNGSMSLVARSVLDLVPPRSYCVDSTGALVCAEEDPEGDAGPKGPEVRKCCGSGAQYSEERSSCVSADSDHPQFEALEAGSGFPVCKEVGSYAIGGELNKTHWMREDGSLEGGGSFLAGTQFCLERIEGHPPEELHVFTCTARPRPSHEHDLRFTLYPVGLFLSVFFLAVTLIASCLLPSTYHVLHWRCQTNHVACLLVGELLLAITQISGSALQAGVLCKFIAITMHFMFLAAFFWLNTMCFNIWWTFRDLRPASLDKGQEACRLRVYEVYAWGGPLIIAGIAALLDNLPSSSHSTIVRPQFGKSSCWFKGDAEQLSYFYGPIGVLLLLNLTLFAATARELTCGLWKTEVVKSNTERATLGRVCLKLVVVMGVTWVSDVVSWAVGGPNYVWYVPDLVNTLQGVMIFCVVGCQPQVWAAVKRLWCLGDSPSEGANPRSSSSHALPSLGDQNTTITKPIETLC